MNTTKILILTSIIAAALAVPAMARGPGGGGNGGGARNTGVCPNGFEPGTRMGQGLGAGACDGTQQQLRLRDGSCAALSTDGAATAPAGQKRAVRGNPNSTGTPVRDGSGKATAPGRGPKDGTGNNPQHPTTTTGS